MNNYVRITILVALTNSLMASSNERKLTSSEELRKGLFGRSDFKIPDFLYPSKNNEEKNKTRKPGNDDEPPVAARYMSEIENANNARMVENQKEKQRQEEQRRLNNERTMSEFREHIARLKEIEKLKKSIQQADDEKLTKASQKAEEYEEYRPSFR